jgi:hypothetical protein
MVVFIFRNKLEGFFFGTEGDIETNAGEGTEGGFEVLLNVGNQTSLQ